MKPTEIPCDFDEACRAVAEALSLPKNLGIEMRILNLRTEPETQAAVLFVVGVADEERVNAWAIEPLQRLPAAHPEVGPLTPARCESLLPAARLRKVFRIADLITGVLDGETAILLGGAAEAILVQTERRKISPVGVMLMNAPYAEVFDTRLMENVGRIRARLRDPGLIAEGVHRPEEAGPGAALLYLKGTADPALISRMRDWVMTRAKLQRGRRARASELGVVLGLLPEVGSMVWPEKAALLLKAGYVVALIDQFPVAYSAPVTTAALLCSPGDDQLRAPLLYFLRFVRIVLTVVVLTAPAMVVALLNYHQELIPTPFLLTLAASREHAALPVIGEILMLLLFMEVIRENVYRLPMRMTIGNGVLAGLVVVAILFGAGLVGPVSALVLFLSAFASLALPCYELLYMVRVWQFPMLFGAAVFGLYGLAAVSFVYAAYLCHARSFGVPYIGESGVEMVAGGFSSSRQPGKAGRSG